MEKLLSLSATVCTINDVMFIDSCQFMLSSFDELCSKFKKDQFKKIRKYLELFYIQLPNQLQINNVTESRKGLKTALTTTNIHIRSTTTNWRRLGIDELKRSLLISLYGLFWTISRTTATTQKAPSIAH